MATIRWRGDAPAVAQVSTATPANVEIGDLFTLTINGKGVAYTAVAATVADVVAGLVSAVANSSTPEFAEITATDTTTEVTLTAKTAGKPFAVAGSAANGGGADTQTLTVATSTASSGSNHWDVAANWSTGAVPVGGDDIYLEDSDVSILYGLDQSAVGLNALNIAASYTGEIGLAAVNSDGANPYAEYRPRFLAIGATTVDIGRGAGNGSPRIQLDTGSGATSITVHASGTSAETDLPTILWKGTHASNILDVRDGATGVALFGGETATLATLRQAAGEVRCGAGVTLGDVQRSGQGKLQLESAVTTMNQSGGETVVLGSGAIGTLALDGGRLDYRSSGTISSATLDGVDAVLDFSADLRARTVTACTLKRGLVLDPHQTVTWSGGILPTAGVQAL